LVQLKSATAISRPLWLFHLPTDRFGDLLEGSHSTVPFAVFRLHRFFPRGFLRFIPFRHHLHSASHRTSLPEKIPKQEFAPTEGKNQRSERPQSAMSVFQQ
jgi:hypothetical protein